MWHVIWSTCQVVPIPGVSLSEIQLSLVRKTEHVIGFKLGINIANPSKW